MNKFKGLFISKRKLLERLTSLEGYVGAEYKSTHYDNFMLADHEPIRESYNRNPIAKLIIKSEEEVK